jgi:hypothetical protein
MFLDVTPVVGLDVNSIVVNVVLSLIGLVITGVGGFVAAFLKSKLNANQLDLLETISANVVLAVEQSTYGKDLANDANAKKAMAEEMMAEFLKKYGITLNAAQLDTAIESAVANVLNANKLVEPPKIVEVDSGDGPLVEN